MKGCGLMRTCRPAGQNSVAINVNLSDKPSRYRPEGKMKIMSRLDIFIARMTAQKNLLEYVAERIADVEGPVFELGLGNGRTFDHLREILPDREIFVFDRAVSAHPSSVPDGNHMVLGEIRDTLAYCGPRVKAKAALIHCDLGTGDPTADLAKSAWLSPMIADHIAPGGYVPSGIELDVPGLELVDLPPEIQAKRYMLYRMKK